MGHELCLFTLVVCTIILFYKLFRLRRDYERKITDIRTDIWNLKTLIESYNGIPQQPSAAGKDEIRLPEEEAEAVEHVQPIPQSESLPMESPDMQAVKPTQPEPEEWKPVPAEEAQAAFARSEFSGTEAASSEEFSHEEPTAGSRSGLLQRWERFKANVDWELFTGVKLFAGLGGLALFIAAGFFVKYSIDRNLIPPALRLAISAVVGLLLIVAGGRIGMTRYAVLRHTLGAGGIGVLYSVVFAATLYYEYLSRPVGFGLLTVVSTTAFVLAVYFRGIPISVLGAIGAYVTPIMVSTGQGSLTGLFLYLAIINLGLYQVVKRLNSAGLLLLAAIGTFCTLFLGTFWGRIEPGSMEIAGVWIANLALFSVFLGLSREHPEENQLLSWTGNVSYLSAAAVAFLLLRINGTAPLLIVTAGMAGAAVLAFRDRGWFSRVIPYGAITFAAAFLWAWLRFEPGNLSWGFVVILVYGAVGCLGPVILIRKYGLDHINLRWFRIFPVAMGLMVLAVVLKNPAVSFWLWPLILVLELMGLLVSLVFGAALQAALLVLFFIISGGAWLFRMPPDLGGLGFYGFLLFAGAASIIAIVYALMKLPEWRRGIADRAQGGMLSEISLKTGEWVSVFPAAGAFILLAAAFWLQRPLKPNPGMFTLVSFLSLSLFLSRRLSSQNLCITVLLSSLVAQGVWIFRPDIEQSLFFSGLSWSGALFCAAIIAPFIFFSSLERWPRVWAGWALYEVVQGLFVIWTADHIWPREMSGWSPLILAFVKLPVVAVLQRRLKGLAVRNSILAFHGGVLLFYVSAVPVMLLDQGWLGLTFVIEASLLLWLNRRVEHEGLRWVAANMALIGLALLFLALPHMKAPSDMSILNNAVLSVAGAVVALGAAVPLSAFPQRKLGGTDLQDYFRWLAVGAGFFLLNLAIADLFAEPPAVFRIVPGSDAVQAVCYGLIWLTYGAFIRSARKITMVMRNAGLLLVCAGAIYVIALPLIFPNFVPGLPPIWNMGLLAYMFVMFVLLILILREQREQSPRHLYNILLTLFLITGFMAGKTAVSTFVQPGQPFHLFFRHTPTMAVGSAAGWLAYGLGLLFWPRGLDKPFRAAGIVLVLAGLVKVAMFPFMYRQAFGAMTPLINNPTLVFVLALAMLASLTLNRPRHHWPFEKPGSRAFWGVLLAVMTFMVLNIEISSVFSETRRYFSLQTFNSLAHQLAYSMGWLLYSTGLLVVGIKWNAGRVRWAALVFLVGTALKIFFMDLWRLGQLYRVASFVGLAVVLILVSFLYQRFLTAKE